MKNQLIVVGAVFVAAVAFYYIASPYQNCKRDMATETDPFNDYCLQAVFGNLQ